MSTILLIILVLLVVGALPTWPYSTGWGYYPSGGLGLVVIIVLILVLTGRVYASKSTCGKILMLLPWPRGWQGAPGDAHLPRPCPGP